MHIDWVKYFPEYRFDLGNTASVTGTTKLRNSGRNQRIRTAGRFFYHVRSPQIDAHRMRLEYQTQGLIESSIEPGVRRVSLTTKTRLTTSPRRTGSTTRSQKMVFPTRCQDVGKR